MQPSAQSCVENYAAVQQGAKLYQNSTWWGNSPKICLKDAYSARVGNDGDEIRSFSVHVEEQNSFDTVSRCTRPLLRRLVFINRN